MRNYQRTFLFVGLFAVLCIVLAACQPGSADMGLKNRMYDTYESFSSEVMDDPVLEVFVASDEARAHDISYAALWGKNRDGKDILESAFVVLDSPDDYVEWAPEAPEGQSVHVIRHMGTLFAKSDDSEFQTAESYGVRSDYMIDGVTVQKFCLRDLRVLVAEELRAQYPDEAGYERDLETAKTADDYGMYWERVRINNEWYYVFARDEGACDSVATALAQLAGQFS